MVVREIGGRSRRSSAVAPTRILSLEGMAGLVRASTGWETSSYELMRAGERRLHLMRWHNLREGLTAAEDRLPDRFHEEPIAAGPRKGTCWTARRSRRRSAPSTP
jgi:aldehyde:ferredoxin oxidoreductase